MDYWISVGFASSIIIPAVLGLIRLNKINNAWYPFLIAIWLGLINESLNLWFALKYQSNAINTNIFLLLESFLFTWQFYNWGLFQKQKRLFAFVIILLTIVWVSECFFIREINFPARYFRIVYSFLMVIMAINIFNQQVALNRSSMLKNPVFVISTGFILYYSYKAIVAAFSAYGFSVEFLSNLFVIMVYINCLTNLIYAYAITCMDKKHPSSLQ